MEQQRSRPLQVAAFFQVQLVHQLGIAFGQRVCAQPPAHASQLTKGFKRSRVQVGQAHVGHGHAVPVPPQLAQQKTVECRTLKLLLGTAAAQVVFTPVADGAGVSLHLNGQPVQPRLGGVQIHRHHNAQNIPHFVGYVF